MGRTQHCRAGPITMKANSASPVISQRTGGRWKNGNDIRGEIQASENYGTLYYTMSYRPANHSFDGEFRRIRVTVKGHPEWTVLTKAGYYALQFGGEKDFEHQVVSDLSTATFEAMPFSSIGATLMQIERIKGTDSARFTFHLDSSDLQWHTDATAKVREADIGMSGAALGSEFAKGPLASEAATWKLTLPLNNEKLPAYSSASIIVSGATEDETYALRSSRSCKWKDGHSRFEPGCGGDCSRDRRSNAFAATPQAGAVGMPGAQ